MYHKTLLPPDRERYDLLECYQAPVCHAVISGDGYGGAGEPCAAGNRPYFHQYNNTTRGQIAKIGYSAVTAAPICLGP